MYVKWPKLEDYLVYHISTDILVCFTGILLLFVYEQIQLIGFCLCLTHMCKSRKCWAPDQSPNMKFPTSAQADLSSLGTHCIAKNCGASLCGQEIFWSGCVDAQADLSLC